MSTYTQQPAQPQMPQSAQQAQPQVEQKKQGLRAWMVALIVGVGLVCGIAGGIGGGMIYHATAGNSSETSTQGNMQMPGGGQGGPGEQGGNGQPPELPSGEQPNTSAQ